MGGDDPDAASATYSPALSIFLFCSSVSRNVFVCIAATLAFIVIASWQSKYTHGFQKAMGKFNIPSCLLL
jgi:hypothetical protein